MFKYVIIIDKKYKIYKQYYIITFINKIRYVYMRHSF